MVITMIQTLYTGATGLTGQQRNIDVIANNVSNINTDGFVRSRFDFQDALYLRMRVPKPRSQPSLTDGPERNLMRGAGAIDYQTARIFQQGPLKETGRVLDFALDGRGFFVVENPFIDELYEGDVDQSILMLRDGSFHLSVEEEGEAFLVDGRGRYVLNLEGERIMIPEGISVERIACSAEGLLTYTPAGGETVEIAQLMLLDFVNPGGLESVGGNAFMQTDNSGEILEEPGVIGSGTVVRQRVLEGSNVDYAEEVTRLIRAQRVYQLASRVVTTADQMMGIANSIRR
jgi:flagellar basal-body rod protein FlgG